MKAVYNIQTKQLIVIGDNIKTLTKKVDEMGEWDCVLDLHGKPKFDIQLDFDDSCNNGRYVDTELISDFYNFQFVNLVDTGDAEQPQKQGQDWQNAEVVIMNGYNVLGIQHEYVFDSKTDGLHFFVERPNGTLIVNGIASLNTASDLHASNEGSILYAIDHKGIRKDL
jgi:hypothetical protein